MKKICFFFALCLCGSVFSNVTVYFNYGIFSTTNTKPYLETYLTISGNSVKYVPNNGSYQANVNISWKIVKGTEVMKESAYNLMSPKVADTLHVPSFIDNQRFSLPNGDYTLELVVADNANPAEKTTHVQKIRIDIKREKKIYQSDVQVLESFTKTTQPGMLTKNGYDLVPYNINYFPKDERTLRFYVETYNVDTVLGNNIKFVYAYYIENSETLQKSANLSGFKKQTAHKINPLLAQLDITNLPTGNYNLVIEIKDSVNIIQAQKKWYFQRQSDAKEIVYNEVNRSNVNTIEDFFNLYQNRDSLKQFIECLWPRSTYKEREWQQTQITNKDPNLMRSYLVGYWKGESGDTISPFKIWIDYYKEVLMANALMKCGKQQGYYTDRGRVFLQYGKPDQRQQVNSDPSAYPYEIWQYYRIYDKSTGRFFTNKKFVFANFNIADDCYKLIHSDVKGELYDDRWKFRLVKRSQNSTNSDDTNPEKTYGNNIDDNFNNPR